MNGTAEDHVGDEPAVPLDSMPVPVISYSVGDGDPVLEHANRTFVSAFGECEPHTPLREWWDSNDLRAEVGSVEDLVAPLGAGERIDVDVVSESGAARDGTQTYRLRSRPAPVSGVPGDGYLVFTESPSNSETAVEVDRIASVISHELRNPLDVAKAHLQAARERGDEEHFDQLADAHDRMEQIIKDVLTLARKEDAITPSPGVELQSVASDAWATVDTPGASLRVEDDLPTIEADRDRLQRLFENLFRNSVEHARPAGSTASDDSETGLQVQVGTTADGGFFVADDGVGIPAVERGRAFEPGYSSDDSGVGLGLAIVEQIAEAHGWTVSLGAGTNGGARFEFGGLGAD
jgi:signal transduction histidine kinase